MSVWVLDTSTQLFCLGFASLGQAVLCAYVQPWDTRINNIRAAFVDLLVGAHAVLQLAVQRKGLESGFFLSLIVLTCLGCVGLLYSYNAVGKFLEVLKRGSVTMVHKVQHGGMTPASDDVSSDRDAIALQPVTSEDGRSDLTSPSGAVCVRLEPTGSSSPVPIETQWAVPVASPSKLARCEGMGRPDSASSRK